ncbi:sugar phosphate isomerase/epimerase family protein [Azotosporobacter soli]|uniref:sugar phosphate isomerase/epimerase family protein n=1 Tax=Azotosporobacter soli TaxID=3055040 RepID=UPI0031FED28C
MLQCANLSNYSSDQAVIANNPQILQRFLKEHCLNGLEMMFCDPWDAQVHKKEWVQGVHLRFWPNWLDFWRGDKKGLARQFSSQREINEYYGGANRSEWLEHFRRDIRTAREAEAKYLVFHVSNVLPGELFHWQFSHSNEEVIEAAIDVVNELTADIPPEMELLFENLWWPGLTLRNARLTARLLEGVRHEKTGIMLDTGHLMNTNPGLSRQEDGVEFILDTLKKLGEYRRKIKGIHLHCSLSGQYVEQSCEAALMEAEQSYDLEMMMRHVLQIDEHLPFETEQAKKIVDYVEPDYLVHEFMFGSLSEWGRKISLQQQALEKGNRSIKSSANG